MSDPFTTARLKRLLAWLLIAATLFVFIYYIRSILLPFVVGMMTAYFLDPAADRLEKLGLSRGNATVIITVIFFSAIVLAGILVIPLIVQQFGDLVSALPGYVSNIEAQYHDTLSHWLERIKPDQAQAIKSAAGDMAGSVVRGAGDFVSSVFISGFAVVNVVMLLLITPLVAFYLLRDWDELTAHVDGLLPRAHAKTIRQQLRLIDVTLAAFIRGQMNVCMILAVFYAVLLSAAGLHFGLIIGIGTGLLAILPYVGFASMCTTAIVVCLLQYGVGPELALVGGTYAVGQLIESYFLTPKLVGDRVGLHPLWIIFGMLAGAALFGFVGVLLAVPLTAVAGVLIRFATERYMKSSLYNGR